MKKLLLSLTLAFVMAFSCTAVGFASVPDEVSAEPRATSMINIGVNRSSGTYGYGSVNVNFAGTMDSFTVTVYLQKLSNGSWINDTSNEDFVKKVTGTNKSGYLFDVIYDDLTYGSSYRIKVVSKTIYNNTTYTSSGFSQTF